MSADGSSTGQAVARNQDGSLNSPDRPAHIGEILTFYYTGGGVTSPTTIAGSIITEPPPVPVELPAGQSLHILSASELPGFVSGLFQLKIVSLGSASRPFKGTISISPTQALTYWYQ